MWQVLIPLLAILAIFAFVPLIIQKTLTSDWLNEIYITHIRSRSLDRALREEKREQIDEEYYNFKLAQLSAKTDKRRETTLGFFENVPADPRLAQKLIELLPAQKNPDIRQRMACLLCETLDSLAQREKAPLEQAGLGPFIVNRGEIQKWSIAISIWLSQAIVIAMLWSRLIVLSIEQILLISLIILTIIVAALIIVIKDWRHIGKVIALAIAIFSAALWAFSESSHTGITPVAIDLASYGIPGVQMHINYPNWLTADDIGTNNKVVTILVTGDNSALSGNLTVSFNYNRDILRVTNRSGNVIPTRFEFDLDHLDPSGEPQEFYLQPYDDLDILKETPRTTIKTYLETENVPRQDIPELEFAVQLENPLWKTVRDVARLFVPVNGIGAIAWLLWDQVKKSKK